MKTATAGHINGSFSIVPSASFNKKNNTTAIECLLCANPYIEYFINIILVMSH